jgi:hypothetical protein
MALLTSVSLNTITTSPIIVPTALLPLTHQCDTSTTFLIMTGRTKEGFYFRWLTNLKFSENKLKFPWEKTSMT